MKKTLILLLLLTNFLFASIGQITALRGEVKITRDSKEILAKIGEELEKNDVINSAKASKAQITLNDNTIITIGQNSTLNIFDYVFDENKTEDSKASFGFMKGSFKSITGTIGKINKERFKLRTKSATIGIRGTTIIGDQNIIACTDGAIRVTAAGISVNVEKQEFTTTPQGQAPTPPEPLKQNTLDTLEQQTSGDTTENQEDTSTEEEKKDSKNDKDGTLTPDKEGDDTPPNVLENTPPVDPTPPDVLKNTPPNEPVKPDISTNLPPTFPDTFASLIIKSDNGPFSLLSNGVVISNFTQSNITGSIIGIDNLTIEQGVSSTTYDSSSEIAYGKAFFSAPNNVNYNLFWVTGVKTAQSIIQNTLNQTSVTTKNFQGTTGSAMTFTRSGVNNGTGNNYNVSSEFNFNFGGGNNSFTGDLKLTKVGTQSPEFTINVNNGTAYSTGFKSTNLTSGGTGSGALNGGYFGTGSIKAIGGTFNFTNGTSTYTGNFVAKPTN